mgnify:CR=1 FL=1
MQLTHQPAYLRWLILDDEGRTIEQHGCADIARERFATLGGQAATAALRPDPPPPTVDPGKLPVSGVANSPKGTAPVFHAFHRFALPSKTSSCVPSS